MKMTFQICRICYTRGHNLLNLEDDDHRYLQKLTSCIPEIDVYVISNAGICQKCAKMLDIAFELREICLRNEKQYKISSNGLELAETSQIKEDDIIIETNIDLNLTKIEGPELDNVAIQQLSFCDLCNLDFKSNHDRQMHDYKVHRQQKHIELKSLLPPIINNKETLTIELEDTFPILDLNETCMQTDDHDISVDMFHVDAGDLTDLRMVCHICDQRFESKNKLETHMTLHLAKCCGESFVTASLLQLHMYKEHNMLCDICNKKFDDIDELFRHVIDHTRNNWFKCNLCYKQFKENADLDKHVCTYYTCKFCHMTYFTVKSYNNHMETHKSPVTNNNPSIRDKTCGNRSATFKHKRMVHNVENVSYMCQLCSEIFKLDIHLRIHMLTVHCNSAFEIDIIDCKKDSFYKDQEGLVINFETPSDSTLNNKSNLDNKEIENRRNRTCFICRIMFSTKKSFVNHLQQAHNRCCGNTFKSLVMMLSHNFQHYLKNNPGQSVSCGICMREYETYVSLHSHRCKNDEDS